jgi:hypothetical protein
MARKLVLCASSLHLTAGVWTGRRLDSVRRFVDTEEDQQAFASFLRGAPGVPVYLMADTLDEDYRFETLPHTMGRDRADMVERKLKQLYRSTPFYGANLSARDDGKRRDDRYLFAALTNPEVLNPWLRLLTASGLPVAGVFPVPMVSMSLVKTLELKDPNLLLVSKHEAGIRQTFIREQQFRISRLTPVRDGGGIESYAEEIRNTRMYLDALNVTHVDDVLTVVVLDQDASLAALGDAIRRGRRNMQVVHVTPQDLMSKVGIDRSALEATEDALHLFLLGQQKSPGFNLAPPALTSGYTRYRMSRGILAASVAAAVVAGLWCGVNVYQTIALKAEARTIADATREEDAKYEAIKRSFPPAPASWDKLQATVEVAGRIATVARLPDAVFRVVSQGLDRHPTMKLNGLQWRHGRAGLADGGAAVPVALAQSAILQIELTSQPGDIKGSLANINSFVRELGKSEQVAEVKVTKMPLDLASSGTLSGSTSSARQEQAQASHFDVELVLKPGV